MVVGINNITPLLTGTGDVRATVPNTVTPNSVKNTQPIKDTNQISSEVNKDGSSAISKSVEKRSLLLSSGNIGDFLTAAEKYIDASLPRKAPGTRLRITLDAGTGQFVYQGININTGDVVTQFPSEEILKFVAFNRERESHEGIVVDKKI